MSFLHHHRVCDLNVLFLRADFVFVSADPHSEIKLIDFGLALELADGVVSKGRAGTIPYMSPQIADRKYALPRTGRVHKGSCTRFLSLLSY